MNERPPTGRVIRDADGLELIVERTVAASVVEAWEWLTVSANLSRWIGEWTGEPGVGKVIEFTMTAEDGAEPGPLEILVCDRPRRFLADIGTDRWRVGFSLEKAGESTIVFFTQALARRETRPASAPAGSITSTA